MLTNTLLTCGHALFTCSGITHSHDHCTECNPLPIVNDVPKDAAAPRETVKERNRRAIIEAAGELASTRGMGGFTVVELAERAGTSRRSIFNHFRSADDAVYSYLTSRIDPLIAALDALPQRFDSIDELILRFEELARSDAAYEILHHVGEVLARDHRRPDTVLWASELVDQTSHQLAAVIHRRLPNLSQVDVQLVSHSVISAIQASQTVWANAVPVADSREDWTRLLIRAFELVRIGHSVLDH